ncbi:hypothetical protein P153DRAFT_364129 [Dothidotthia symphoricarpi CBS 119687]|uniref:Uncharacterized protein n=1 Tax=Dothidotthia symphoricarpi CBS 119687 TaxID=1392245 RepID=A0A6A6ALQ5_9PLEO|nr:uncharacterized protein P153DRAFT_364129 [Dothidotthia symphoricarpi CBS 119687]KAF2132869.1 hypothetical protein P153DRAFT_364129 [Dothidotthia symphoricarpi CBS 119687]
MHDHLPPRAAARQTGNREETRSHNQAMAPSQSVSPPSRQHSEESWIELGSGPSSSSLSSVADEIITTGLTVQHDSNMHRRNRPRQSQGGGTFQVGTGFRVAGAGGGTSSQEEYDESESESDRVMTSSNEAIAPSPLRNELHRPPRGPHSVASSETTSEREDEEDDENATAVNYPRSSGRGFQPRPNAFSHPNTQPTIRSQSGTVHTPRRTATRPSHPRQHSYPQHSPYNILSPNHHTDQDEALRASLSTLLSAAAAVRGLPKPGQPRTVPTTSSRMDPTSLRLVPESVALGDIMEESSSIPSSTSPLSTSSDKPKRKAIARSNSKDRRVVKKARSTGPLIEEISPTLLTWVVSASVLVLLSALSFSAGYVVGKEAGHAEAIGVGKEAGGCGKELKGGLGLRKLRWSGGAGIKA